MEVKSLKRGYLLLTCRYLFVALEQVADLSNSLFNLVFVSFFVQSLEVETHDLVPELVKHLLSLFFQLLTLFVDIVLRLVVSDSVIKCKHEVFFKSLGLLNVNESFCSFNYYLQTHWAFNHFEIAFFVSFSFCFPERVVESSLSVFFHYFIYDV